jgi:hypothetical protein
MKYKKCIKVVFLAASLLPSVVFSQVGPVTGASAISNPSFVTGDFATILNRVVDYMIDYGIVLLGAMVVWTGFLFVKAQGNEKDLGPAKQSLIWTIVGGAIIIAAKGISLLVQGTVSSL